MQINGERERERERERETVMYHQYTVHVGNLFHNQIGSYCALCYT